MMKVFNGNKISKVRDIIVVRSMTLRYTQISRKTTESVSYQTRQSIYLMSITFVDFSKR